MNVKGIFSNTYTVKLPDCRNIINYPNRYKIIFDKIVSLITEDGWVWQKIFEMTLQKNFLRPFGKDYSALVPAIKTG